MSGDNAEVVRKLYAGWEAGRFDVALDAYDPDVELVVDYGPDRESAKGLDEMRRLWREQITLWESLSTGPIEELTGRGDHVVVRHSLRARTRQGLSVESHQAGCAFTFRDGRVIRIVATDAIDKALAAAGLSQAGA